MCVTQNWTQKRVLEDGYQSSKLLTKKPTYSGWTSIPNNNNAAMGQTFCESEFLYERCSIAIARWNIKLVISEVVAIHYQKVYT